MDRIPFQFITLIKEIEVVEHDIASAIDRRRRLVLSADQARDLLQKVPFHPVTGEVGIFKQGPILFELNVDFPGGKMRYELSVEDSLCLRANFLGRFEGLVENLRKLLDHSGVQWE